MTKIWQILLVDDEDSILGITQTMLERIAEKHNLTCDIKTSNNAVHALYDLAHQQDKYDLVFLDIRMPKVCGTDIYRSMQMMNTRGQEKVVFVTAYPEDLIEALPGASLKVLRKPFRIDRIERIVLRMFALDNQEQDTPWEVFQTDSQ